MVYSTYLGGSGFDEGAVIKVDDTGAAYVGGSTNSIDFPSINPARPRGGRNDGFITKLSPSGAQIVYSTYLGGTDNESVADLAIDAQKNVYVIGDTAPALGVPANDFPLVNPIQATHGGGFRDGFMSIIHTSGSPLLFSTYFGGDGDDVFQSVNIDPSGQDILLAYFTDSSNFLPSSSSAAPPSYLATDPQPAAGVMRVVRDDVFLVQIEKNGRLTFVEPSVDKRVMGIILGSLLIVSNRTASFGQPSPPPAGASQAGGGFDVRMEVLDQNLNITKSTLFGGSGEETFNNLATDSRGAVYVVGRTRSTNLPVINPIQANLSAVNTFDGFLAVFQPKTLQPLFATYLGGTLAEGLSGVTVDAQGNIYVVGDTSGNFPTTTPGAFQSQLSGRSDAFIIKISPVAIPLGSTPVDFDGDGRSDIGLYRSGTWFILRSSDNGITGVNFGGVAGDIPVPADYDGDGKTDIALYRNGTWFILRSSDNGITGVTFGGLAGDILVPADYDGDGKADIALYRNGTWFILRSSDNGITGVTFGGLAGDILVPADYDGDGKADIALYRNGTWFILRSSDNGITGVTFGGLAGDILVYCPIISLTYI